MSSSFPEFRSSPRRGLRWWQWLAFITPTLVTVGVTWIYLAVMRSRDEASGFTYLDPHAAAWLLVSAGITGLIAGAVSCLVCGIVLGCTTRVRDRWLGAIGWTLLCGVTNAATSFGGCSLVDVWDRSHRAYPPAAPAKPPASSNTP